MTKDELKIERKRLGLSQQKLANALGVARISIAGWEAGRSPIPQPVAMAIAHLSCRKMRRIS